MNALRRLLALVVLCCLPYLSLSGQIVNNSGFAGINPLSTLTVCTTANVTVATATNRIEDMCLAWLTPTNGTPDFFYGCDNPNTTADYGVPTNQYFVGNCEDAVFTADGTNQASLAYAGISIVDSPTAADCDREYITQALAEPLSPGRTYKIMMSIRSSNLNTNYLIQRIGCLLTVTAPTALNTADGNNGALNTGIGTYVEAYDAAGWSPNGPDYNGWHRITLEVTVGLQALHYITIGNFQADIPDAEWMTHDVSMPPVAANSGQAYYFIDDVFICDNCPDGVEIDKLSMNEEGQCCYSITFTGDTQKYCSLAGSFSITVGDTTYTFDDDVEVGVPITVCLERFTTDYATIILRDDNNEIICSFSRELKCDCTCDQFVPPSGFSITLQPSSSTSTQCCWDVVVNNDNVLPGSDKCDISIRGIRFAPPAGSFTPAAGYSQVAAGGSIYVTQNNVNGGDIYEGGTSTVIGQLCLPQGTVDFSLSFSVIKSINGEDTVTCGGALNSTVSCASKCCNGITVGSMLLANQPNPLLCCFTVSGSIPGACVKSVELQQFNGISWTPGTITPTGGSNSYSLSTCIPATSTRKIRLLFRDTNGVVVCIKEHTLSCENSCCTKINNLQAYRVSTNPCCYVIHGTANGPGPNCPSVTSFIVQQYNPSNGTWTNIGGGAPAADGSFNTQVCVSTSKIVRITFYNGSTVVCTKVLQFDCPGIIGKVGSSTQAGVVEPLSVHVQPNPTSDIATVQYTLSQASEVRITLFNALGEMIAEQQLASVSVGEQSIALPMHSLPAGVYFVQVSAGGDMITVPVTVVK